MKKLIIICSTCLILLVAAYFAYKAWQRSVMDLSDPQIESLASISNFSHSHVKGDIVLVAKDSTIFKNIENLYGIGSIWVFNSQGKTIEANIEKYGGSCFEDIKNYIVKDGLNFSKSKIDQKFFNEQNDFYNQLFEETIEVNNKEIDPANYDYIVTYGWAKYYGMTYKNDQVIDIYNYIKNNNKKVLLVAVNTDQMDFWRN